jgi:hypothetical protein
VRSARTSTGALQAKGRAAGPANVKRDG